MKKNVYTLVYQGGLANIFLHVPDRSLRIDRNEPVGSTREWVYQSDFRSCENFARGLIETGAVVRRAWANVAGDVALAHWHFTRFEDAPFCEKFAKDFV